MRFSNGAYLGRVPSSDIWAMQFCLTHPTFRWNASTSSPGFKNEQIGVLFVTHSMLVSWLAYIYTASFRGCLWLWCGSVNLSERLLLTALIWTRVLQGALNLPTIIFSALINCRSMQLFNDLYPVFSHLMKVHLIVIFYPCDVSQ
jgi:hypothetical protein